MLEDLRQAFRTVLRSRGVYLLVAGILALSIAATVTTLTLADAVLLRPPPYPDGDRLVTIYEQNLERGITQMLVSHPTFEDLQTAESLDRVAAYQATNSLTLAGTPEAIRVQSNFVSLHYFSLLGARAELGTLFSADTHKAPMAESIAVLSWPLWQARFGGGPEAIGSTLELNGHPFEVVGVLPKGFDDLPAAGTATEVWLPLETYPILGYQWPLIERRTTRFLGIIANLDDGFGLGQARAEIQGLGERLSVDFSEAHGGYSLVTRTVGDFQAEPFRPAILALLGGAFFVLLIGCANAANLLLVRATTRRAEIAMHLALGAGSSRMARRLTLEGLITSLAAGALGVGLGYAAIRSLLRLSPVALPDHVVLEPSPAVLAVTLAVAIGTGLLFGLVPGLAVFSQDLNGILRSEGRGSSRTGEKWRRRFIVVEVASAVTLLLGGLLMTQSFRNLTQSPLGFETEGFLTLRTSLPAARYDSDERLRLFARDVQEGLASEPGVESPVVWAPGMPSQALWYRSFAASDRPISSMSDALAGRYHQVSAGALQTLGIPLLRGRGIEEIDHANSRPVVVISESAASSLFGSDDPLGRSLYRFRSAESASEEVHYTVVGVVADARHGGRVIAELPPFDIYYAFEQLPSREVNLLVKASLEPSSITDTIRRAVRAIDPQLPLYDIQTMQERVGVEAEQARFSAFLGGSFAILSAALAGLGLYSVLAYFAQARIREIGLRMALGGRRFDIVAWMGRQTMKILAAGLALGLIAALAVARFLESILFGVDAWDPIAVLSVLAATSLVAVLASLLPMLRASRVDPAIALRSE